ncbi:hypothetical protein JTE90_019626 [Oedothorax gibbosus]|uniref:Uncharacterized protein n=1 Tax=Oedothorax gibbosus TaxID=931172 RepID=A0AAV6THD6_9ARAC|nr:hypothetical protein JTE90_019626 [Oedothorax gibbosus]
MADNCNRQSPARKRFKLPFLSERKAPRDSQLWHVRVDPGHLRALQDLLVLCSVQAKTPPVPLRRTPD